MNIKNLTKEDFRLLIANADDSLDNQIRIKENGDIIMYSATPDKYQPDTQNYKLRSDAMHAGNGYVGIEASKDEKYISTFYNNLIEAWENGGDLVGVD